MIDALAAPVPGSTADVREAHRMARVVTAEPEHNGQTRRWSRFVSYRILRSRALAALFGAVVALAILTPALARDAEFEDGECPSDGHHFVAQCVHYDTTYEAGDLEFMVSYNDYYDADWHLLWPHYDHWHGFMNVTAQPEYPVFFWCHTCLAGNMAGCTP